MMHTRDVEPGYRYYRGKETPRYDRAASTQEALEFSRHRWNARLTDPDYLILRRRRRIFAGWVREFAGDSLAVLDIGGRLQPYRPLFDGRVRLYVAVDPQPDGLTDVIAMGEELPFTSQAFDLVVCAQVLNYVTDPGRVTREIHRVLRPSGALLLSVPAFFPQHHDERWRFLSEGLRLLLSDFSRVDIVPEVYSIAGICRTVNVGLRLAFLRKPSLRVPLERALIPGINMFGLVADKLSHGNQRVTPNYSALAIK
jgi:SAM-dependent methyltransferase